MPKEQWEFKFTAMTCLTFIISTHLGLNKWYMEIVDTTFCPCCVLPSPIPGRSASPVLRIFRILICAYLAYWNWMIPSAAWHYWWLNESFCSGHIIVHCQWGGKPPKLPRPLGILSPYQRRTEPRPNLVKIVRVALEIADRRTRTHRRAHHNNLLPQVK